MKNIINKTKFGISAKYNLFVSIKNATDGITLIALVVTIVILIILATISINAIIGENGLIAKAEQAKKIHENAVKEEKGKLEQLANILSNKIATDEEIEQPKDDEEVETISYIVTYDANGGSGEPTAHSTVAGTSITLSTIIPEKAGYTFLGWSEDNTAASATYVSGETMTPISSIKLYAVWEITGPLYSFKYSGNDEHTSKIESVTLSKGKYYFIIRGKTNTTVSDYSAGCIIRNGGTYLYNKTANKITNYPNITAIELSVPTILADRYDIEIEEETELTISLKAHMVNRDPRSWIYVDIYKVETPQSIVKNVGYLQDVSSYTTTVNGITGGGKYTATSVYIPSAGYKIKLTYTNAISNIYFNTRTSFGKGDSDKIQLTSSGEDWKEYTSTSAGWISFYNQLGYNGSGGVTKFEIISPNGEECTTTGFPYFPGMGYPND